jgi:hypothetical protein
VSNICQTNGAGPSQFGASRPTRRHPESPVSQAFNAISPYHPHTPNLAHNPNLAPSPCARCPGLTITAKDADRNRVGARLLSLRRQDTCSICGCALAPGTKAWWDSDSKTVSCGSCRPAGPVLPPRAVPKLDRGQAGASADREYRRRKASREEKVRRAHPKLGGLLLALNSAPQHEAAFARGAGGEWKVGTGLERRIADGAVVVLHDRRLPHGRGNIDHLAVAPSGVYVIDAKAHQGKIEIVRPWFGPEKLLIKGHDWTRLLDGLDRQVEAVRRVLAGVDSAAVPVQGALCFTNADLPWLRTAKMRGHLLIYGRALAKKLNADGPLSLDPPQGGVDVSV